MKKHYFCAMKHLISIFVSILFSLSSVAQSYRLYTSDAELSSALVHDIYQDHLGVVWIATEDGLTRYDGVKFFTYKHDDKDEHSLAHNLVRCVMEDKAGNIYVGTHRGLQCYNRAKNCFSPIARDEKGKLMVGNVNKIVQMSDGEVWASGNELFKAELRGEELIAKSTDYTGPHTYLQDILEDKEGNIWVTHLQDGIFVCKKKTKVVKQYLGEQKDVSFLQLATDANGNVYVGTHGLGVVQYNKNIDNFETIEGTRNFLVSKLYMNPDGQMLIGSDGLGLYTYNTLKKELSVFPLENKFFNASRAKIHAMMYDNDGDLWLGIFQKGVMFLKNKSNLFQTIGHRTFSRNIIGSEAVSGITEDASGRKWICTDNDGVYSIEKDGTSQYHFSHNQDPNFPTLIINIAADKKGRVWVASYTDGLGYFTSSGRFVRYPLYAEGGKEVRSVMDVMVDGEGRVWAATLGSNVYCVDSNTDKLIPGCSQVTSLDNWQCALYMAKDGTLFVGSFNGLFAVEVKNGKAKVIGSAVPDAIINSIAEDRNGDIWLATTAGLSKYERKTKKVFTYTTQDGLPSNTVYAVRYGSDGYIWATTSGGLSQFGIDGIHRSNYSVADGLQGNEFAKGASFTDSEGNLWFGGINGVTYFNPSDMSAPETAWDIRVVDFFLNNKPVNTETKSGWWQVIDTDVMEASEFHLCSEDNSFTIEFGVKQLNAPDGLRYEYTVNGGSPEVLPAGVHGITFSNLPHGKYKIRVSLHGHPEVSVCEVTVYVHTVWYNHWLAWIVYLCLFALGLYHAAKYTKKHIATQRELQEHQHQDEINNSKLQMFTNISHDIRTPMTLIISPLEKLMKDDSDEAKRKRNYETMHRNASRILNLVNQLMDVRKIENGKMEMSLSRQDIIPVIGNVCESFVEKAAEKNVTFTYIHDGFDHLFANIDLQHFDKIFANLISNAMKFVPEGGVVTVCINKIGDDKVQIAVNDNGIGIPEKDRAHIFERFYQVRDNDVNKTPNAAVDARMQATGGTGVGLHLAKAIVEMHGGTIRVDDGNEGIGCRIVVEIPFDATAQQVTPQAAVAEAVAEPAGAVETKLASVEEKQDTESETKAETKTETEQTSSRRQQVQTNYRVLIVDDDPEIAEYIRQELSGRYHCSICNNGRDALESVLKNPPHLVISDVLMPEMSGIELTKRIKANVNINHIPVVLVTALSDTQSNVEGLNVGAAAYLTKPFDVTLLKTTVDNIIKSRQRLKNVYEGKQTVEKKIPKTELDTPDERLMKRVMKIVEQHIFDHNLSVELLATEVGISRVHLNRKLKELTNQTTTDFIKNIRLKRAAELLGQKKHSIAEVADMVGFQNANNFSTAFRKLFGVSPRDYMNQGLGD